MYEQHFGLKKRPFRASANGTDVFVGPHIAAIMAGLKKALTANDAIVTVSGPVGSGKTTLVNRALESIGSNQKTILVTRMRLNSNDVLELLLDELGLEERPNGTFQKFALFRRHLKKLAESDTRVFIAIEDGTYLGVDTLAEVEALTAADAGESEGASIVLMGDEGLNTMLSEAPLARIQQRIRRRLALAALPLAEMRSYLRHCFLLAGRDFEQIFEPNAAELLHHLSNGIPRIANNLVESAMTAAADQDMGRVATTLLARIAENEYGLSAADFDLAPKAELTPVADIPAWDRDPTMAELTPDIAALEQAMAFAQADAPEPVMDDAVPLLEPEREREPRIPEVIPEITLDTAISQRIRGALIDEPSEISAPAPENAPASANDAGMPELKFPPKQNKNADAEIKQIANEFAMSIEDVDDKLAETLFGDETNFVAAQVLANPPSGESANDEHKVTLEAPKKLDDSGMDPSLSQRLKTVRALNADPNPSISEPEVALGFQPAPAPVSAQDSIEDQINTSMTQTQKALNVTPPVFDGNDDNENMNDFFSRFKKP